jgi:N-acetylmuramoyl-L-alanine amidase
MPAVRKLIAAFWMFAILALPLTGSAVAPLEEKNIKVASNPTNCRVEIDLGESAFVRVGDEVEEKDRFFVDVYGVPEPKFDDKLFQVRDGILRGFQTVYYPDLKVLRVVFFPANKTAFRVADAVTGYVYPITATNAKQLPTRQHSASRLVIDTPKYKHYPFPPLGTEGSTRPSEPVGKTKSKSGPHKASVGKRIVVIDPGHGGKSLGAVSRATIEGKTIKEKDVVLAISLEVYRLLNKTPNITAVLTRDKDDYLSLNDRVSMAENLEGDLFVSVHANATKYHNSTTARGAEFFYLSEKSNPDMKDLEMAENDQGGVELDTEAQQALGEIFDHMLADIIEAHRADSAMMCESMQGTFLKDVYYKNFDRGVKSAAFRVLMNRVMPATLVEVGFIDNDREVRNLAHPEFQKRIAKLIVNAIEQYFAQQDGEFPYYQYELQ